MFYERRENNSSSAAHFSAKKLMACLCGPPCLRFHVNLSNLDSVVVQSDNPKRAGTPCGSFNRRRHHNAAAMMIIRSPVLSSSSRLSSALPFVATANRQGCRNVGEE